MQRDGPVLGMVLRIFLRVIAQTLQASSPGTANANKASFHIHIGAVACIHRFGFSLNEHVHFHVCAVDGVFDEVAGQGRSCSAAQPESSRAIPTMLTTVGSKPAPPTTRSTYDTSVRSAG